MSQARTERQRLDEFTAGEHPGRGWVEVLVQDDPGSARSLARVRSVMHTVLDARAAPSWPDRGWWEARLPSWLLDALPVDGASWTRDSWIESVRDVGWVWWSSYDDGPDFWGIHVRAVDQHLRLEGLLFLAFTASGGRSVHSCEPWTGRGGWTPFVPGGPGDP